MHSPPQALSKSRAPRKGHAHCSVGTGELTGVTAVSTTAVAVNTC